MVVDVHAHHCPTEYLRRMGRPDILRPTAGRPHQGVSERSALVDLLGVGSQVLSVSQAQPHIPTARDGADAAQLANDRYVEMCARHLARIFTFAPLPSPHVDESLDEIARVADDPAVVGMTLGPSIAGIQLDGPVLEPVLEELDRRHRVVFVHPVGQESTPWLSGHTLAWSIGEVGIEDPDGIRGATGSKLLGLAACLAGPS